MNHANAYRHQILRALEHYVRDPPQVESRRCNSALKAFFGATRLFHKRLYPDQNWAGEDLKRFASAFFSSGELLVLTLAEQSSVDVEVVAMYQRMVLQVQVVFERLVASLGGAKVVTAIKA